MALLLAIYRPGSRFRLASSPNQGKRAVWRDQGRVENFFLRRAGFQLWLERVCDRGCRPDSRGGQKPWFNGKLDFTPPVVFDGYLNFQMAKADGLDVIENFGKKVACVRLPTKTRILVTLFVWPADAGKPLFTEKKGWIIILAENSVCSGNAKDFNFVRRCQKSGWMVCVRGLRSLIKPEGRRGTKGVVSTGRKN